MECPRLRQLANGRAGEYLPKSALVSLFVEGQARGALARALFPRTTRFIPPSQEDVVTIAIRLFALILLALTLAPGLARAQGAIEQKEIEIAAVRDPQLGSQVAIADAFGYFKKLAFTQGNSQVLILAKLAKIYGFDASKVTLVNMQPSEGVVAASKGDVQGLLGWQPNLFRLVKMGGTMYVTGATSFIGGKPEPY